MPPMVAINAGAPFTLSHRTDHSLPLSKLSLLQRMASNNNEKCKMEEEAESSMVRKRLWRTDDDGCDDDSFDLSEEELPKEEPEEEETEVVSSEETSMNQLDTSKEKLYARCACGVLFSDDGDTTSTSSKPPPTPESHWCSDEESSDDDDNF
jgi:hypothetical protein